jgi:hypothetical protein
MEENTLGSRNELSELIRSGAVEAREKKAEAKSTKKTWKHVPVGEGKRLTGRDFEVLEFINDMRFAGLDTIHPLFFGRKKRSGEKSRSSWYARERVLVLRRLGMLKTVRVYTEGQSYYVATDLGVRALQGYRVSRIHPKALGGIDIRSFEHDKRIVLCRAALELGGRSLNWRGERLLKAQAMYEDNQNIGRPYQPDAIYTSSSGAEVAFELEHSFKSKERYQEKFERYVADIRYEKKCGFEKCLFVATTENMKRLLIDVMKKSVGEREIFKVVSFEEVVRPLVDAYGPFRSLGENGVMVPGERGIEDEVAEDGEIAG